MTMKPIEALLNETKIYQIINPKLVQAPPDISIQRAIQLMQENKGRYMVVAENKKVVGIFTESDVAKKILGQKVDWQRPIRDVMTKETILLTPNDSVWTAMDLMSQHRFYHIPLVDQQQELCGILTVRSIVRFLSECYPTEVYNLPPNPNQVMRTVEGG